MNLNYHELTMNEPRDSPARRQQYRVICAIGAAVFVYTLLTSGMILPVDIKEGNFAGGTFVYKYVARDYACSGGLMEKIGEDSEINRNDHQDLVYSLYLDNPRLMGGRRTRFASGVIIDKKGDDMKKSLLAMNKDMPPAPTEPDTPASVLWNHLEYQTASLPNVNAGVTQFPFTNGFVSALILEYKVIPAMRKYVQEHGEKDAVPVVISTCDRKAEMCTHYAPLLQGKKFLLGQPDTDAWLEELGPEKIIDFGEMKETALRWAKRAKGWFGMGSASSSDSEL